MFFIIGTSNAFAFPETDRDFSMLPEYCSARYNRTRESITELWKKRIGKDWVHVHHYCSALNSMNHANLAMEKNKTNDLLKHALSGFDYLLDNGSNKFPLLPELHTKKGDIYRRLGNTNESIKEYETAISIYPKYAKAYSGLSDLYKKQGNKQESINILKKGLKQKPDSKLLLNKLHKIENK